MTCRRITSLTSVALALLAARARPAAADPEACAAAVRAFTCDPLPEDNLARGATLATWDAEARAALGQHRFQEAAALFGCLLVADPRPENASNLSVALKQSGDLPSALSAATCAEQLNVEGSEAQARARARREAIQRLLAALVPAAEPPRPSPAPVAPLENAPALPAADPPGSSPARIDRSAALPAPGLQIRAIAAQPEPASGWPRHRVVRVATLAVAATLLIGATVAYVLAHDDASQFQQEQSRNGFTPRAEDLREKAQRWQGASIGGFVAAGLAGLVAAVAW